jgi:hypothetical protein
MPEKDYGCFKALWLERSMKSAVLFNALLTVSAAYQRVLYGARETRCSLKRKSNIIKCINAALDDPVRGISDEIIGAVACLTASEVCTPLKNHGTEGKFD